MSDTIQDSLLFEFFKPERWETAINNAVIKDIDRELLKKISSPDERIKLYHEIRDHKYKISPPHEARIPKDDGTMRTVYVNTGLDRVILAISNELLFELCHDMIHPSCKSYQTGIGCGKIVQKASRTIKDLEPGEIGVKMDLSKYFDTVPIEFIDDIFAKIEDRVGHSALLDVIKDYYHDDTVIDYDKNLIQKYSSLRQGCAVAAFLADAVLYDLDEKISSMTEYYVRYSDDILILGENWKPAFEEASKILASKGLKLNPKKIEYLNSNQWFTFLGFMLRQDKITLSKNRVKTFQKEIEKRTIRCDTKDTSTILKSVYEWLYVGKDSYSWATGVLPIINVDEDIKMLNGFIIDAIRASVLDRKKIGGLGSVKTLPDRTIVRGQGRHVRTNRNRLSNINGYVPLQCMRNALLTSRQAYNTLVLGLS